MMQGTRSVPAPKISTRNTITSCTSSTTTLRNANRVQRSRPSRCRWVGSSFSKSPEPSRANHSFSHVTLSVSKNKTVLEEIEKTDALIEKYSGKAPVLCRAPGGSVGKAAKLADKPFIHWSVDTLDWKTLSKSYVVNHIKKTVRDGSIILMHDLYGSTAAASEVIIPWLISEGYQLVTVSELLEARYGDIEGGRIYYNGYAK